MANDNFPRGLVPLNWPNMPVRYYRVSTATDIFLGMPVAIDANGFVSAIDASTAGAVNVLGVAVGFAGTLKRGIATNDPYLDVSDLTPPDPSSDTGDRYVLVADDPNQEYVIQGDTGGTLAGAAAIGNAATLIFRASSGNTTTGWANLELDASTNVTTTAGVVLLLRGHDAINSDGTENTLGANYAKWIVKTLMSQKVGLQLPAPV